jgi:hypothetical protein
MILADDALVLMFKDGSAFSVDLSPLLQRRA